VHRPAAAAVLASFLLTFPGAVLAGGSERPTVVVETDGGFAWLDAGIGAASMLALIAVVYGGVLLRRTATRPGLEREIS
jgi:hypothetical protein